MTAPRAFMSAIAASATRSASALLPNRRLRTMPMRAPLSPSWIEKLRVVVERLALEASPHRLDPLPPSRQAARRHRRRFAPWDPAVSCVWAIGTMPVRLSKADGRLDAHNGVGLRRRHDRAAGLGSDRCSREVRRDRDRRSGARAGRTAIERVRIPGLPAARAPAARGVRRAEVRPLAQVGLAEDDGAGVAQARHDERILWRSGADQRERSGRRHHAVCGGDVVLDDDRDAVQRAARAAGLALRVELVRNRQRVGIDLDEAVE